jgi:hypothetical protein
MKRKELMQATFVPYIAEVTSSLVFNDGSHQLGLLKMRAQELRSSLTIGGLEA